MSIKIERDAQPKCITIQGLQQDITRVVPKIQEIFQKVEHSENESKEAELMIKQVGYSSLFPSNGCYVCYVC